MIDWFPQRTISAIIKVLVSALLLIAAQGASAGVAEDNVRFSRLSLDQGLSQSSVNCIAQDSQGMMWFGVRHAGWAQPVRWLLVQRLQA